MNEKVLAEYVEIEATIRKLEDAKEILRSQILSDLKSIDADKVESELFGTFSITSRTTWKYSPKVNEMEEKLKIAKVREQDREVATPIISESLRYTPIKK